MKQTVKYMVRSSVFECTCFFDAEEDPEWAVEECAEDFHSNHDGWECAWPLDITLLREDRTKIGTYEVERESRPVFFATTKETK